MYHGKLQLFFQPFHLTLEVSNSYSQSHVKNKKKTQKIDQWLPRAKTVEWEKMGRDCSWILWGGGMF